MIGAWGLHEPATNPGSAYIFVRSGAIWTQQQKLLALDGVALDLFGDSVSVCGDTALIGAPLHDAEGLDSGAAYVFTRSNGVWTQQQKLTASDAKALNGFGFAVSLEGDTAIVGASADDHRGNDSGSAYVFVRSNGVWTEQQKLTASDATPEDLFGGSVSVSGNTAVIGAFGDDDAGDGAGAAYVFVRNGSMWTEQQKLTAVDGAAGDQLGHTVSISGDTTAIAAVQDDDAGIGSGSVYVFTRSNGLWTPQQKLTVTETVAIHTFGHSLSLSEDSMVIGAYLNSSLDAVYVFTRLNGVWTQQQKLSAFDEQPGDQFSISVSLSLNTVLVGSFFNDNIGGIDAGAAYIFELPCKALCSPPDCSNNGSCDNGTCICDPGWSGPDCATPEMAVPTISGWGITAMTLLLMTAGSALCRKHSPEKQRC